MGEKEQDARPRKCTMWDSYDADALARFAQQWLRELRGDPAMVAADIGYRVTVMNFTAPPDKQWLFLLAAIGLAEGADELGHIAAGPMEHLLGFHGEAYIDRVVVQSDKDPKFARALTGARQHLATDEIWARVERIQAGVPDPLPAYRNWCGISDRSRIH